MGRKRANGEGSVKRLPNGTWVGQIMVGYTEEGKRKILSFSAPTKSELLVLLHTNDGKNNGKPEEFDFCEWAEKWFKDYETEVQPSTYANYRFTLNTLINYFSGKKLPEIKTADINAFLNALNKQGWSMSKISKCRTMLFQIFKAAVANDYIVKNPVDSAKSLRQKNDDEEQKSKKDAFSPEEIGILVDKLPNDLLGNSVMTLIGSGMRVQELLALSRDSIASDGSSITVKKAIKTVHGNPQLGPPKSRRSRRTIPIPEQYRFFAKRLRELGGDKYIWTSEREDGLYSVGTFRKKYYHCISNIEGVRNLSPHCCRHTYVTMLQAGGVPLELIARLTGHAKIATTDKYAHTLHTTLENQVCVLNNIKKMED